MQILKVADDAFHIAARSAHVRTLQEQLVRFHKEVSVFAQNLLPLLSWPPPCELVLSDLVDNLTVRSLALAEVGGGNEEPEKVNVH